MKVVYATDARSIAPFAIIANYAGNVPWTLETIVRNVGLTILLVTISAIAAYIASTVLKVYALSAENATSAVVTAHSAMVAGGVGTALVKCAQYVCFAEIA